MLFSFRYKLSLIISFVALLILLVSFFVIDTVVEKEFRLVIEQHLLEAEEVVNQRMEDRYDRLLIQSITVAENKLTQDILTDENLSMATRDDILSDEIMPTILLADSIIITDGDGLLLATSFESKAFWKKLNREATYQKGLTGVEVSGVLSLNGRLLQWLLLPVFIGDQMFGTVVLVSSFDTKELLEISQLTGTELLISYDDVLLTTAWHSQVDDVKKNDLDKGKLSFLELEKNARKKLFTGISTIELNLQGERYLARYSALENPFTPPYLLGQSLDRSLAFVETIKQLMLTIGIFSLFIAAGLGFIFSNSVSRPIQLLSRANRAVAREDFSQRVNIQTRDEFRELGESFNQMTKSLAEKEEIRSTLDKSVSREVADHLMKQGATLGGESREVTILFADMKGFTSLSEKITEQQLLSLLNSYFSRISTCIKKYNGTIDKYIGDAVMVLFGAPANDELHALHAIQAAHEICKTVQQFNEEFSERYGCQLDIGIGINTGMVVSGLIGSEDRMSYTVLGDHVNIASRVEGLSGLYGARIIVTGNTRKSANTQSGSTREYVYRCLDRVQMKGKTVAVDIYQPILNQDNVDEKCKVYNRAYRYILDSEIKLASREFESYLSSWPDDDVVKVWRERCEKYKGQMASYTQDYINGVRIIDTK